MKYQCRVTRDFFFQKETRSEKHAFCNCFLIEQDRVLGLDRR